MRVVFDTNITVSAFFWQGAPRKALDMVRRGDASIMVSEIILAELHRVLSKRKFAQRFTMLNITVEDFINDYRALVTIVEPAELLAPVCDDPDDDAILACALGGQADAIVSGDDDLLRIGIYNSIPIWNVNHFLAYLENRPPLT
jgi:putative PIN family toxin of toxin-antitoxin system